MSRRILLVGDVHGNDQFFRNACTVATEQGCETILQLGDFGYWEHFPRGAEFLNECNAMVGAAGLVCYWLDGNHENHELLRRLYGPGGKYHNPTAEGFWPTRSHLIHLPRGVRWEWNGVRFLALGGAYSVDQSVRTPGVSWWPEETITSEESELAAQGGPVDVIMAHDCPLGVSIPGITDIYHRSELNRGLLLDVVKRVRPTWLFHGHYHRRYSSRLNLPIGTTGSELEWHSVRIEGLGCDMDPVPDGYYVLDLDRV